MYIQGCHLGRNNYPVDEKVNVSENVLNTISTESLSSLIAELSIN